MSTFDLMPLPKMIKASLANMGFTTPTPIQADAIPALLSGKDLIGSAQTGTGKTAAFGIPLINHLIHNPQACALVLAPTRELAQQICDVLKQIASFDQRLHPVMLIGGVSMQPQVSCLRKKPRLVVATPGRLNDHLRRRNIQINNFNFLILDEADRMLDMGFLSQIEEIIHKLPKNRQTALFSATFPKHIQSLAHKYLKNPERIKIGAIDKPIERIVQKSIQTTPSNKNNILIDELNKRTGQILIFARTKSRTDKVAKYLLTSGYKVSRIHGGRSQAQRTTAIQDFRDGRCRILVATDIAARGIDIPDIQHVINYDLPQCPDDFIHRIGRTARAGSNGEALSLLIPEDKMNWRRICRI